MVMEAVEKKPHLEDESSPKSKKENLSKEEKVQEPVSKKKKIEKVECKNTFEFFVTLAA